ncbi:hypothetical protein LTR36_008368 [Oleoguttula mirabilis]|uniref:PQ loop repeat protein n=1 Tax=Oleoguttula mirabilis TaxID=1507867 RepID=A0AAV9J8H3_9PEZI|nr:hypothetical protein LTR36_008368 [Oleoguttula mirabilis]
MLSLLGLEPTLPPHCEPTTDFLLRFSTAFHTCVPTPLAFTSDVLGTLSIIAWLFAQLPQIYKNWSIKSTSGLSIFFLVEWCLGDISNVLGALFTHQATWQVAIGGYYVFVDLCMVGQWMWYERLRHGSIVRRVWPNFGDRDDAGPGGTMEEVVIEGMPISQTSTHHDEVADTNNKQRSRPRIIFRQPTFEQRRKPEFEKPSPSLSATPGGSTIHRVGGASPMPSPSPRTVLLIACLVAIVQASPLAKQSTPPVSRHAHASEPTALEIAGTILSWLSTVLYLGSRLPQLYKNWRRKSTAGLSPHLFMAAFCGNLLYSSAMLTNPRAWYDFGPYGGGGWVGADGSDRTKWVAAALPFFIGAAGVLGLDASVGIQCLMYGEVEERVVVKEVGGREWHWRRVSGWMRGWVPSISEGKSDERDTLIGRIDDQPGEGYGTM